MFPRARKSCAILSMIARSWSSRPAFPSPVKVSRSYQEFGGRPFHISIFNPMLYGDVRIITEARYLHEALILSNVSKVPRQLFLTSISRQLSEASLYSLVAWCYVSHVGRLQHVSSFRVANTCPYALR